MDCFLPIRFRTSVQLAPSEINVDFNQAIITKLRTNLEGICTRFGYIKPQSIEVVKRSAGQFVKQHFNGHIRFEMVCKAEVCNPPQGLVVKAIVKVKNEMGVLAESSLEMNGKKVPVLDIIVPLRAAGIVSEVNLENVNVGDEIYVSVLSKRYQLRDKKISVIGRAMQKPVTGGLKTDKETFGGVDEIIDAEDVESYDGTEEIEEETEGATAADAGSDDEVEKVVRNPVVKTVTFGGEEEDEDEEENAEEDAEDELYGGEDDDFYEGAEDDYVFDEDE